MGFQVVEHDEITPEDVAFLLEHARNSGVFSARPQSRDLPDFADYFAAHPLPDELWTLTDLRELDLSNLELSELPPQIGNLTALRKLNLERNALTTLPDSIGSLTKLRELNLEQNRLTELPASIGQLKRLRWLSLRLNALTALPDTFDALTGLDTLWLDQNQFTELPVSLRALTKLRKLDIYNPLITLPEWLGELTQLETLGLYGLNLTGLPEWLRGLRKLQNLHPRYNALVSLPEWLGELTELRYLYLDHNRLTDLPDSIANLTNLETLDISNNQFTALPATLAHLPRLKTLALAGNPFPADLRLLYEGKPASVILDHLRATHDHSATVPLNEVKVIVIGEAGVGKSAVVRRLMDNDFDPERKPTMSINIRDWVLPVQGRGNLTLHMWDFGGQTVMHNTHQLFLSTRTLYLLVLDATKDEASNGIVKWLKNIHLVAPDAPVIIVINWSDKFKMILNQKELQAHHPVTAFIETSCKTGEGIAELRAEIENCLRTMPHLNEPVPIAWMKVRRALGATHEDYLEFDSFTALCEQHGVEAESESIAHVLNSMGVLLTYRRNLALENTHVLNPNWVTDGIYPILTDEELAQRGGYLESRDVRRLLKVPRYPNSKHAFIVEMMIQFELAFEVNSGLYLVPDLLPKQSPDLDWDDSRALRLIYQYDFMPPGIFTRFVVQMYKEVNLKGIWRSGVELLQGEKAYARAIVLPTLNRIELSVRLPEGDRRDPRTLLDTLRARFANLHKDFEGLKVDELIPIPGTEQTITYASLLKLEQRGIDRYFYPEIDAEISVRELLAGISAMRPGPPVPTDPRERRERLVRIMIAVLGTNPNMRDTILDAAGLLDHGYPFDFTLAGEDFARHLIRTLANAGIYPDTNEPALNYLLRELRKRRSGFPEDVALLTVMESA